MTRCENLSLENAKSAINQLRQRAEAAEKELAALKSKLETARKYRDIEWWEKLCCVDNVEPTPEAVKLFILSVNDYFTVSKEKVQPLVDCLRDIASLDDVKPFWVSVDASAVLQQWENSQNAT